MRRRPTGAEPLLSRREEAHRPQRRTAPVRTTRRWLERAGWPSGVSCDDASMAAERVEHPTVPEGVRAARDLRAGEPRAFGVELEGYAHLPRMLDKARATLAGTAGRYLFGCPVDQTCMARPGVTPELVLDLAARHADDGRVLDVLLEHGIPPAREAWFDAVAVEDELQDVIPLEVRRREELPEHGEARAFAGADHGADVDV